MKIKNIDKITLQNILHYGDLGVHVIDKDRKTIVYNEVMAKIEGLKRSEVLEKEIPNIITAFQSDTTILVPTLFIKGALSNYILEEDKPSIRKIFIDSQFETIEKAGHWVHAEQPELFLNTILSFCLL